MMQAVPGLDVGSASSVHAFEVPHLGFVLSVTPTCGETEKAHPIVILDTSGSMGPFVKEIVNEALSALLISAGYELTDELTLVFFASSTSVRRLRIADLARIEASALGMTYIAPVFKVLQATLDKIQGSATIICISDGSVCDQKECMTESAKLHAACAVTCISVRLGPGNADTTALMCIARVGNVGMATVLTALDVTSMVSKVQPLIQLRDSAKLEGDNLRVLPSDEPLGAMQINVNEPTMVLASSLDNLKINGVPIAVIGKPLNTLQPLHTYLGTCLNRLAVLAVSRTDSLRLKRDLAALAMLGDLADEAEVVGGTPCVGVQSKIRQFRAVLGSRSRFILTRIAELGNQQKVASLNSAQCAALVNGTLDITTNAARGLATRAGGNLDFDAQVMDALRRMTVPDPDEEEQSSYITLESSGEVLRAVPELLRLGGGLAAHQILSCIGCVGIAYFAMKQGPLPDPWKFRCEKVCFSTSCPSEADVVAARIRKELLLDPGTRHEVSGVVPIRSAGPNAFDAYNSPAVSAISDLHTSLSVRGLFAFVPYTGLARDAGVWFAATQQASVYGPRGLEVVEALADKISGALTTYAKGNLEPLKQGLASNDPLAYLTGAFGVSDFLKPLMLLAIGCPEFTQEQRQLALQAIYAVAAFRACPRPALIWNTVPLGDTPALTPAFEQDRPYTPDYKYTPTTLPAWAPDPLVFEKALQVNDAYGTDVALMCRNAVWLALLCNTEAEMVDKDNLRSNFPNVSDRVGWVSCIERLANDELTRRHALRVSAKSAEQASALMHEFVEVLLGASLGEFVRLLNGSDGKYGGIANQNSPGFADFQRRLLESPCIDRKGKIEVIMTGSDGEVKWANGNVLCADAATMRNYQTVYTEELKADWHALIARRKKLHDYRPDLPNRHGHGNDLRSYKALGFDTLELFKKAVSDEMWAEYTQLHCKCCGVSQLKKA
jgi:hypothetical protein